MWIKQVMMLFLGILFGGGVSCGFIAFLLLIGVIPRLAAITKSAGKIMHYENMSIYGIGIANIIYLYNIEIPLGMIGLILYGFFAGCFIGALAGALAEVVNTFPILSRRMNLRKGIPYIVYSLAFGKGLAVLLQYYILDRI